MHCLVQEQRRAWPMGSKGVQGAWSPSSQGLCAPLDTKKKNGCPSSRSNGSQFRNKVHAEFVVASTKKPQTIVIIMAIITTITIIIAIISTTTITIITVIISIVIIKPSRRLALARFRVPPARHSMFHRECELVALAQRLSCHPLIPT